MIFLAILFSIFGAVLAFLILDNKHEEGLLKAEDFEIVDNYEPEK